MISSTQPLIVDSFAGGGGASTGIEMALGRSPDIAINHDAKALAMHAANHPETLHLSKNIWHVDPLDVIGRRRVGLAWFSPDCKHFSKAKGGKPVQKNIRDLAWVVVLWAQRVKPAVIMLENVEEFLTWCPLDEHGQPDFNRKGETFQFWLKDLKKLGYKIEYRLLRACDYGAPTIRKRLFLIARRDGLPIVWPEPTHGEPNDPAVKNGTKKPWITAADCIDWSIPCPSIFATRQEIKAQYGLSANRPLAPNTLKRIARGVQRYVLDNADPFILHVQNASNPNGTNSIRQPLRTITAHPKGGGMALVSAFMAQHNTGVVGRSLGAPLSTITTRGTQQQLVAAHMLHLKGSQRSARPMDAPLPTITAGGLHSAQVSAFLTKYYGTGGGAPIDDPFHTVTTKDRFGLVMVGGEPYAIHDIGMRMLTARELFRAQGFPEDYIISASLDGKPLTKTDQVAKCGNSVSPPMAAALVRANCQHLMKLENAA